MGSTSTSALAARPCGRRADRARRLAPPPHFDALIRRSLGARGEAWLAALPTSVDRMLARWELRADGRPTSGWSSYVLPVRTRRGAAAMLKLTPYDAFAAREAEGLAAFGGSGACRLYASSAADAALLVERIRPGGPPPQDEVDLLDAAADCLRRLDRPADGCDLPPLADVVAEELGVLRWLRQRGATLVTVSELEALERLCDELARTASPRLVHGDFCSVNLVDGGSRGAVAIDPKACVGDRAYDCATFAVRYAPERAAAVARGLAERAGLSPERAEAWTLLHLARHTLERDAWREKSSAAAPPAPAETRAPQLQPA